LGAALFAVHAQHHAAQAPQHVQLVLYVIYLVRQAMEMGLRHVLGTSENDNRMEEAPVKQKVP